MATSDLLNELPKDSFRLDAEGERRVCQASSARSPPRRSFAAHALRRGRRPS